MILPDDELMRIARKIAERIYGAANVDRLDVSGGYDWAGDSAYFIDIVVAQDPDREAALDGRLRLRHDIRDGFVAAGDETYPYVRVHNRAAAPAGG